jgi:hypothetical protein
MRDAGLRSSRTNNANWWLWDGKREWRVGVLTPEQAHYSIREIVGLPVIVDRILDHWTPAEET